MDSGDEYRWNDESIRIIPRPPRSARKALPWVARTPACPRRSSDSLSSGWSETRSKLRRKESLPRLRTRHKAKTQGRTTSKRQMSGSSETYEYEVLRVVIETPSESEDKQESDSEIIERYARNFNSFDEARARPSRVVGIEALAADTAGRPTVNGVLSRTASPVTATATTTTMAATQAAAVINGHHFFPALPIYEEPGSISAMDRRGTNPAAAAATASTAALAVGGMVSPLEQGDDRGAVVLRVPIEEAGDTGGDGDAEESPASPTQAITIVLERFAIAPTEPEGEAEVKSGREQWGQ